MPKVTQKGQVTIPQNIREAFSFHPGSEVEFRVRKNEVILLKSQTDNRFLRWLGAGKKKKKEDIDLALAQIRGKIDE